MSIADSAKRFGFNRVYDYLDKDPRANLPKIMELVDKITPGDMMKTQRAAFRRVLADPDNNWNKMIMGLWDDIDPLILKKAFQNFIINGSITGWEQQQKMRKEH